MQELEQRQREMREKLARAKIQNVQGLQDPNAIFGPVEDYVERRRPITRLFFSIYDNLGGLMAINIFTFLLSLPLFYVLLVMYTTAGHRKPVGYLLPLLLVGLIAPPAWAAASSYCAKTVENEMHPLSEYWSDYRRFAGKSILLALGQFFVGGALIYATLWYFGHVGGAFMLVGIVSLYAFIFWALAGLYVWPLMVRGYSWRSILRNAGVLVVAAPLRSASILFVLVVLTAILSLTGLGLAILALSLWAMLPNQALVLTRERLEKRAADRASS